MCGIAGWVDWKKLPSKSVVTVMTEKLRHRGPNNGGVQGMGEAVFGHRRLSILDLSAAANQPMTHKEAELMITFNGEIYNFKELRVQLQKEGFSFLTDGDTEVLLKCYARWGEACLEKLEGMFAFAVWDNKRKSLFLARDRLGEKPLYYYRLKTGGVIFGSELTSLIVHPDVGFQLDVEALAGFLSVSYLADNNCLISGVKKLLSATSLTFARDSGPKIKEYWSPIPFFENKKKGMKLSEAEEELKELISSSVKSRMISDVPLGAFLSGGLDSTCVVKSMAYGSGARNPKTFSIGFSEKSFNESDKARRVARDLDADHEDLNISNLVSKDFEKILGAMDQPLADTSIIPTYYLAALAGSSVTVALSGDGADELFAGYSTYKADRLRKLTSWIPSNLSRKAAESTRRILPDSPNKVPIQYMVKQFLSGHGLPGQRAHYSWREIFSTEQRNELFRDDINQLVTQYDPYQPFGVHFAKACHLDYLDQALYVDLKTWLAEDILVKLDRATMLNSVEARPPFLDHKLVEWAAAIPTQWKLRGFRGKYVLRRAFRDSLPTLAKRTSKMGFNAPISHWLRHQLYDVCRSVIFSKSMKEYFNDDALETLWNDHQSAKIDHGYRLFALACLGVWLNRMRSDSNIIVN